jgi:methionyl-tRNA synthetase
MAALLHRRQAERRVEDIDFNPDDFSARVNSDLVGKYINIASRAAGFLAKRFGGTLSGDLGVEGSSLLETLRAHRSTVEQLYEEREFGKALREIMGWPTRSTNTSMRTSPGSWPRAPTTRPRCTTCAAPASRPSGC